MLAIVQILKNQRKLSTNTIKICDQVVICVSTPDLKRRHIRKIKKIVGNCRIICNNQGEKLKKWGFCVIEEEKIHKYLAYQIYKKTLEKFEISSKNAHVLIISGRIGHIDRYGIRNIIRNAQEVFVSSSDGEDIVREMMEEEGISAICGKRGANIYIYLYENEFSIHYIRGGSRHKLKNINVAAMPFLEQIPREYHKSICLAMIEKGILDPKRIFVENIEFSEEKLT